MIHEIFIMSKTLTQRHFKTKYSQNPYRRKIWPTERDPFHSLQTAYMKNYKLCLPSLVPHHIQNQLTKTQTNTKQSNPNHNTMHCNHQCTVDHARRNPNPTTTESFRHDMHNSLQPYMTSPMLATPPKPHTPTNRKDIPVLHFNYL